MEVIGLVASITQLLDIAARTIQYLNKVKDVSDDRSRLLREVSSLLPLLANLENQVRLAKSTEPWFDCIRCLAIHNGPIDQLREALEVLTGKLKPKKRLKKITHAFIWTFDQAYCEAMLDKIERVKTRISLALQGDTFALAQAIKADTAGLALIDKRVSTVSRDIENLQINEEAKRRQDILEWFSPLNFFKTQQDMFSRREEGTGQWFIESPLFQDWLSGAVRTLCCPGIPGAGKSVLASVIIDFLRTSYPNHEDVGVTAMYCNFKERDMQSPQNLLAGCCAQLFQQRLPENMNILHSTHQPRKLRPAWKDITSIFETCITGFETVCMIVDALDECSEDVRDICMKYFKALPPNVRLLVTTRHIREITGKFEAFYEIRASPSDLTKYISSRIASNSRLRAYVGDQSSLRQDILEGIVSKADGMFLAAKLHSDMLSTKTSIRMLKKALTNLSNDLDVLYDDALLRIESQHQDNRELAEKALCWIAYSFRPLSAGELQEALAIVPGETDFDEEALPSINSVLDVCAGLLVHDQESWKIRLVHSTVQDYFNKLQDSRFTKVHPMMAMDCMTYLSYDCFQSTGNSKVPGHLKTGESVRDSNANRIKISLRKTDIAYFWSWSFLNYANCFWARHTMIKQDVRLSAKVHEFLTSNPRIYLGNTNAKDYDLEQELVTRQSFEIAAFYGFVDELKGFIKDADNPESLCNKFHLLRLAAKNDQGTAIKALVDLGANVEERKKDVTPLGIALLCGSLNAATTLIDRGADVMTLNTNWPHWSALASIRRFPVDPYLNILLEAGAMVRKEDIFDYTPLMETLMEADDMKTAEKLFKLHGLKSKMEESMPSTTLSVASHMGSIKWVDMLLQHGADVNKAGHDGPSMRKRSSIELSFYLSTRLLNMSSFKLFQTDWRSMSPLMWAVAACQEECSTFLLRQGADVNFNKVQGGLSALHVAAAVGSLSMTEELIKHHASVDIRSEPTYTVKYIKSGLDSRHWFYLLQEHLIDVNFDGKIRISVLNFTSEMELSIPLMQDPALLELRIWKNGMSALDVAFLSGNEAIFRLLKSSASSTSDSDLNASERLAANQSL